MHIKIIMFAIPVFVFTSCNFIKQKAGTEKSKTPSKDETRIVRRYFEDGSIKSEISVKGNLRDGITKNYSKYGYLMSEVSYVNNKKDGPAVNYYSSGKVHSKLMYKNGVKNGDSFWYYKSGKVFRINPFINGKLDGIQKFYYENGGIMAEVPYKNGQPGLGTKEYTEKGELMKNYPTIKIEKLDQVYQHQSIILKMHLSNNSTRVKFYIGNLMDGRYLDENTPGVSERGGVGTKEYRVTPGTEKTENINIIAVYTTNFGMPYVTQKKYNLVLKY